MASTRTHNTLGNYNLQQRQYNNGRDHILYKNSAYGEAVETKHPGNGLNPAQIPWNKLSTNAADIESFLFGINSTNLVKPQGPLTPNLTNLQSAHIYETAPVYLPEPFILLKDQRPNFH